MKARTRRRNEKEDAYQLVSLRHILAFLFILILLMFSLNFLSGQARRVPKMLLAQRSTDVAKTAVIRPFWTKRPPGPAPKDVIICHFPDRASSSCAELVMEESQLLRVGLSPGTTTSSQQLVFHSAVAGAS